MARGKKALATYNTKRDFARTREPAGVVAEGGGNRYLIQKHAASRLHYDLRLELGGTLKSWAVTRGPSLDPHDRRLAVEVEDHPVAYGDFEGTIPKGEYGGGTVMLWDRGTWSLPPDGSRADAAAMLGRGKLDFELHGQRLKGRWTLVRMHGKEGSRHNWLLLKRTDEEARPGDDDGLLARETTSIATGRSMEDIAHDRRPTKRTSKRISKRVSKRRAGGALPPFIAPELATLRSTVPEGDAWVHEIKFDGYRLLAYVDGGAVTLYTRSGKDWTLRFPTLAASLGKLPVSSVVLDGEAVVRDANGLTSFRLLQRALSEDSPAAIEYFVFDLLHLDGKDLRDEPLRERQRALQSLLRRKRVGPPILRSEPFAAPREKLLREVCRLGLEGVVSKRADAPYRSGRSDAWVKSKCARRQEFIIGGFTEPSRKGPGIGALLLGYREEGTWIYAGRCGTGFDAETSRVLRRKLDALVQTEMPFRSITPLGRRGHPTWVRPALVCEVAFTEWTADGSLRHPSFQGLREDKPARDVHRDRPAEARAPVTITHPDRVVFAEPRLTKGDLAAYYDDVAARLVPHVKDRPLSVLRCPDGIDGACFFQRHLARGTSPGLVEVRVAVHGAERTFLALRDAEGLRTLVQFGVVELHPWGCRNDDPARPDRIVFDLDPGPGVPWAKTMAGAKEVRQRMLEFGLESFVKTTGGKGLHVVVPIARDHAWAPVKAFARAVATSMAADDSGTYTATMRKTARRGKIFVDYLRNDLTATAIAPFSVRARAGAAVAMPLAWTDLKSGLDPAAFNVVSAADLLRRRRNDPWGAFFTVRQRLSSRLLRALKIEV